MGININAAGLILAFTILLFIFLCTTINKFDLNKNKHKHAITSEEENLIDNNFLINRVKK